MVGLHTEQRAVPTTHRQRVRRHIDVRAVVTEHGVGEGPSAWSSTANSNVRNTVPSGVPAKTRNRMSVTR